MITLREILTFQAENKISDLHLITGEVPCMRQKKGEIAPLNDTPLKEKDMESILKEIITSEESKKLKENGGYDLAKDFYRLGKFRINIYYEVRGISLNIRYIREDLIDINKMEVPKNILEIVNNRSGLLLITGPNNSGKTTLLNSLIDYLNTNNALKIVTLEDPIEFIHKRKKSLVSQREMGESISASAKHLKYIFRQDADVVCVGEIRDYQTMHAVMTMCEAGYFVMGTLHTIGAVQGIERIVNFYPADKRTQIFAQLSTELKGVLSQTLVQYKEEDAVIPCREVFLPDDAVTKNIKQGDLDSIYHYMETSAQKGNILFDQYLVGLFQQGEITEETLRKNYHDKDLVEALTQ